MKTYIIGHLKPDTDAVVSAMAFAKIFDGAEAVIADPINPETEFLFSKFGVESPRQITASDIKADDQVILVDHNEADQRLTDLNPDQIVGIVDHHKANINFNNPIELTFIPWGSTSTIVYYLMKQANFTPDKTTASLMLAAILSDTVGYKSATTTPKDKELGAELTKIAGITDTDAFTLEIFKAKSDVSKLSDEQIVTNDYKIFDFGGKKVLIDQLETVEQDAILSGKKAGLLEAMKTVKKSQGVDMIFVAITDILKVNTKLLVLDEGSSAVASKAFGGNVSDNTIDIGPKMSRKKEIAPAIEKALS